MFPRLYNSFDSGPILPLAGTWPESLESNVNLVGATKSPKLQNPNSSFAILEVLLKILNVIDVDHDEVFLEIFDSTTIDLDEIVQISNSQFDPQVHPPRKKQKLIVDGIGKKFYKKSYESSKKFQAKWVTKLPWAKGLVAASGIIQIVRCKVCSLVENKDKIMRCKWDILTKHVNHRIAIHDLLQLGVKKGGNTLPRIVPI
jgi:hypothetical protein